MSSLVIAGVLLTVFLFALIVSKWKSEAAEDLYQRLEWWRKFLGAAIAILLAATFVQSGDPLLLVMAGFLALLAGLWWAVEQPHKTLI